MPSPHGWTEWSVSSRKPLKKWTLVLADLQSLCLCLLMQHFESHHKDFRWFHEKYSTISKNKASLLDAITDALQWPPYLIIGSPSDFFSNRKLITLTFCLPMIYTTSSGGRETKLKSLEFTYRIQLSHPSQPVIWPSPSLFYSTLFFNLALTISSFIWTITTIHLLKITMNTTSWILQQNMLHLL